MHGRYQREDKSSDITAKATPIAGQVKVERTWSDDRDLWFWSPRKAIGVMLGLFSECLDAVSTTAEADLLTRDIFLGCQMPWFFGQAGGACNKVTDLSQVFLRIGNKYVNAPLATEVRPRPFPG